MKKAIIIIVVIVAAIALWAVSGYNGLVSSEENVKSAWSQVENVYQRRLDLIPNLVATVKGYAEHEQETLESVVEARSKATRITVDPDQLTEENIAAFQKAHGQRCTLIAAQAKLFAAINCTSICLECLQVLGGNGYSQDFHVERLVRDAKLLEIGEGTNEILRMVIGGTVLAQK